MSDDIKEPTRGNKGNIRRERLEVPELDIDKAFEDLLSGRLRFGSATSTAAETKPVEQAAEVSGMIEPAETEAAAPAYAEPVAHMPGQVEHFAAPEAEAHEIEHFAAPEAEAHEIERFAAPEPEFNDEVSFEPVEPAEGSVDDLLIVEKRDTPEPGFDPLRFGEPSEEKTFAEWIGLEELMKAEADADSERPPASVAPEDAAEPIVDGAQEDETDALAALFGPETGDGKPDADTEADFAQVSGPRLGEQMIRRKKTRPGKTFARFFSVTLLICAVLVVSGATIWGHLLNTRPFQQSDILTSGPAITTNENLRVLIPGEGMFATEFKDSKRVNILLLGNTDENLSDTIILASFDPDEKRVDLISIPRDTYYEREGAAGLSYFKVNATFLDGPMVTAKAVHDVLCGVPINYYAVLSYDGVANIVDAVGGVPFDVPRNMHYVSTSQNLTINIQKGQQVLDGDHAVQYLRWRHGNTMREGYTDGDIGRVKAQQAFMKAAFTQAMKFNNLPSLAKAIQENMDSDVDVRVVAYLMDNANGMTDKTVYSYTLPGAPRTISKLSFWVRDDSGQVEEMMRDIYTNVIPAPATAGAISGGAVSGGAVSGTAVTAVVPGSTQ